MSLMPPNPQTQSNAIAGRLKSWEPKFPDIAVSPDQGIYDEPESGGAEYERAPGGSHCYGWKLQSGGFVKNFYGPSVGAPAGTVAVLSVAFKEKVNGQYIDAIDTEYEYYFTSQAVAENYLGKFRSAAHPGHIVQALIAAGVPYKKKSG